MIYASQFVHAAWKLVKNYSLIQMRTLNSFSSMISYRLGMPMILFMAWYSQAIYFFQMNTFITFHWLAAMAFTERVKSSGNRYEFIHNSKMMMFNFIIYFSKNNLVLFIFATYELRCMKVWKFWFSLHKVKPVRLTTYFLWIWYFAYQLISLTCRYYIRPAS